MVNIVVINYGMGNLRSVHKKFQQPGVNCLISAVPADISQADAIVLPGVGHYGKAMSRLRKLGLLTLLDERIVGMKVPVLGICLGMQLLMEGSEEGNAEGLGWVSGRTIRFSIDETSSLKVPHIGWNSARQLKEHPVLDGIPDNSMLYYVHSYHVQLANAADGLQQTNYGYNFVSAVQKGNIFGFQYHPEKSQDVGLRLIQNFIKLNDSARVSPPSNSMSLT